ncbi:hypothetical protein X728_04055 [Mesorhizobium sp. L103C120A0]|nr:hypothetical protein X728_04055 [Mesorhizobium sp. L103C120A0]
MRDRLSDGSWSILALAGGDLVGMTACLFMVASVGWLMFR